MAELFVETGSWIFFIILPGLDVIECSPPQDLDGHLLALVYPLVHGGESTCSPAPTFPRVPYQRDHRVAVN